MRHPPLSVADMRHQRVTGGVLTRWGRSWPDLALEEGGTGSTIGMSRVIIAEGLTRRFGSHLAVDRLDLYVDAGEVFGFLGPNGAGKTTTVRLLNGLLNPSAGRAFIFGQDVAQRSADIRRRTGVLTEAPSLYDALTARHNLTFFGDLYDIPRTELQAKVDASLSQLGLAGRADDRVATYSKGMRQRLAIARALLHEPPLLFLDEPTAGLDPAAARMVTDLIAQLSHRQGRTIFLCTHNLTEAQRLCDRVGVIDEGRLRALGTPEQLARDLWTGLWVEIDLRGPISSAVEGALAGLPGVRGHSAVDGVLKVELESDKAIPAVVSAVAAAGGRIYRVVPKEHSLEEIYFQIQGNHGVEKTEESA